MKNPRGYVKSVLVIALSIALRFFLFNTLGHNGIEYLSKRIENMSPVTSFIRLTEGNHLLNILGIDPYVSNFFKLNPITASLVFPYLSSRGIYFSFLVACNILSGLLLIKGLGFVAGLTFLFNPYTIVSELGLSAESVDSLFVSLLIFVCSGNKKKLGIMTFLISIIALNKPLIPFILIFPISLLSGESVFKTSIASFCWTALLHIVCFIITGGSWRYLTEVSKSLILQTSDLEPNMGFAWNLFTMSFKETATFYRLVFYGHLFLIGVPVFLRFKKMFNKDNLKDKVVRYFHIMVASMLLFQPYPTGLSFSMISSILVCCEDKFHNKVTQIMSVGLIGGQLFTSAVGPLWLERNTGNANFLFYLDVVSTFIGIIAIGESLRVARLSMYSSKKKD
jgi:hypothetical protein